MTYSKCFSNNDLIVKFDKMEIEAADLETSNDHLIYLSKGNEIIATMIVNHKPAIKKSFEIKHLDNEKVIYFEVL